MPVELREHQVPVLEEPVPIVAHLLLLVARVTHPTVDVQFAAGATRTDGAHGPEVVVSAHWHDPLARNADLLPDVRRLEVFLIDRYPDTVSRQTKDLRRELQGHRDGIVLEIVADGEVAQHLEEGMVTCRPANPLDVVRSNAFLVRRHAHVWRSHLTQVILLQRDHAGCGKQQCPVGRKQGSAGESQVVVPLEEPEKAFSNIS